MPQELLSLEARLAVVNVVRTLVWKIRVAMSDTVAWSINSRDLQRHVTYFPEAMLEPLGIKFPNELVECFSSRVPFPKDDEFYAIVAKENNWTD